MPLSLNLTLTLTLILTPSLLTTYRFHQHLLIIRRGPFIPPLHKKRFCESAPGSDYKERPGRRMTHACPFSLWQSEFLGSLRTNQSRDRQQNCLFPDWPTRSSLFHSFVWPWILSAFMAYASERSLLWRCLGRQWLWLMVERKWP